MSRQHAALALAQADLIGADPVLDELIARHGPARLPAARPGVDRFTELAESIAYQQLNGNAAAGIWRRVVDTVGGDVTAATLLGAGPDALRGAGLSRSKARAMTDLATRVASGEIRLERIGRLDDEQVITTLTAVWGIGRWTAQMFLMFTLGRLDVWPTGDYGVCAGYARAWGLGAMPSEKEMDRLGDRFAGARSLVAWYCWRSVETSGGRSG